MSRFVNVFTYTFINYSDLLGPLNKFVSVLSGRF